MCCTRVKYQQIIFLEKYLHNSWPLEARIVNAARTFIPSPDSYQHQVSLRTNTTWTFPQNPQLFKTINFLPTILPPDQSAPAPWRSPQWNVTYFTSQCTSQKIAILIYHYTSQKIAILIYHYTSQKIAILIYQPLTHFDKMHSGNFLHLRRTISARLLF